MKNEKLLLVPDIGNFDHVEVIDVLIKVGDEIKKEDSLITLESDKASMDIPSTEDGIVEDILVKVGDKVSKGHQIAKIKSIETNIEKSQQKETKQNNNEKVITENSKDQYDLVVLGSGPGGYTAAFRAADLGLKVALVEKYPSIGGVCLNVGCIPSKALLHLAKIITEAEESAQHGVEFSKPKIDLEKIRNWKNNEVVSKLTQGLSGMSTQRKVTIIQGYGKFIDANNILVKDSDNNKTNIHFKSAIIAVGSKPIEIPNTPQHENIIDSTGALKLNDIPQKMLIVGGGIIGLEMGTVYDALGSNIDVVELGPGLIPGCDRDIIRPLQKRMEKRFANIYLNTKVEKLEEKNNKIFVTFKGQDKNFTDEYDKVLIAVGRKPNGNLIDAEKAGVKVEPNGFINVNDQFKTNISNIYAIGDVIGQPMLAHKATHEAKIAAEVIAGHKVAFQAKVIPSVAYTDPEVAWVGITEEQAKENNLQIEKAIFPWAASGRALSMNRSEGMTKLLFDQQSKRLIGASIVGVNAGELIAEACLAIEMGSDASDIGLTIHPHPTLSESVAMASEVYEGTITDLFIKKR